VRRVKELERDGFQFEDAQGSFALLVQRSSPSYRAPFEPLGYHVETDKTPADEGSRSRASVEVAVGGAVRRGHGRRSGRCAREVGAERAKPASRISSA
jgi:2-isopropylmalate synthase